MPIAPSHIPHPIPPMTAGKLRGLRAISTERGIIAALALDQRGSLAALMSQASGREPSPATLREFKTTVTQFLTSGASAILLDLDLGGEAISHRAPGVGLILTYEKDAYANRSLHRMPELIPRLSAKRLKEAGSDCVKLLIHYSPYAPDEINAAKQALVEKVGAECASEDIPFLLEVVGYDVEGTGEQNPEYARCKPEVAARNMAEFSLPAYAVDVLKVEIPVNLKYVAGTRSFTGPAVCSRGEAMEFFRRSAAASTKPFIYLSAGVGHGEFVEGLALAAEAGVSYSGMLCGRAIWQDGARVYAQEGRAALDQWITCEGQEYMRRTAQCLESAQPWYACAATSQT